MSDKYALFIDDLRQLTDVRLPEIDGVAWRVARTTGEAKAIVERRGMPVFISFDHDLGINPVSGEDKATHFLVWLMHTYWDEGTMAVPDYQVHSANPVGKDNIISHMESWKKYARGTN